MHEVDYNYSIVDGKVEGTTKKRGYEDSAVFIMFNESGYKIKEIQNKYEYPYDSASIYKYDTENNLIEKYEYKPGIKKPYKGIYTNNKGGGFIERRVSETGDKFIIRNKNSYDAKGRETEGIWYHEDGSFNFRTLWLYDNMNNIIERRDSFDDRSHYRDTYKYDGKGREIEHGDYDSADLRHTDYYVYDEKGNKIREIENYADGSPVFTGDFTYNEKELLIKEIDSAKGHFSSEDTYIYDSCNNVTEHCRYFEPGVLYSKTETKYEYDRYGNWTKRIVNYLGTPNEYSEREYQYY